VETNKLVSSLACPLVLDVSSPIVQVGIADKNGWLKLISSESQALNGVFQSITKLFKELNNKISDVDAIFFCSGPGSTLGLRLTLACIKTIQWERRNAIQLFSYNAMDLASRMTKEEPSFIQAPFRMGWRIVRTIEKQSKIGKKEILESKQALDKYPDSLHLKDTRIQIPEISDQNILEYQLDKINGLTDLLTVSEEKQDLTIYNPKPPQFKKWKPEIKFLAPE
jgi:tRNA A37 threonylcarbamoyladenosine modification protein TsaB